MFKDPIDSALEGPDVSQSFSPLVRASIPEAAQAVHAHLNDCDPESPTEIVLLSMNNGELILTSSLSEEGIVDILTTALGAVQAKVSH